MDHTLLALSIASVVIMVVAVVLLVVVLRHLTRHRREISALRETAERYERELAPQRSAGDGSDDAAGGDAADAGAGIEPAVRKVGVVLNPTKFDDTELFRRRVREVVEGLEGAEVRFYETSVDDPGRGQARLALQDGADLVIAAGGDGTVRLVASVLAGSEALMGIIPSGTGNLLARNLDIPLEDPAGAITAAMAGQDKRIDVGWLRTGGSVSEAASSAEQIFLVIAGFGADAEMIGHTDPTLKRRLRLGRLRGRRRAHDPGTLGRRGARSARRHAARSQGPHGAAGERGSTARRLRADAGGDSGQRSPRDRGRRAGRALPASARCSRRSSTPKLVPNGKFAQATNLSHHEPLPGHRGAGRDHEGPARAARRRYRY